MSDDRHVGGASAIMNARVAFTLVLLSLLTLLPSPSIAQGEWSVYGNNQYPAVANGPQGYSKWGNNGFSEPPSQNKWRDNGRGPPGGHGSPGLVGNGPPGGLNRNPPGWNKVDTDRPYEGPGDGESIYRSDPNDKRRFQRLESDNRERPQGPDLDNRGKSQGLDYNNRARSQVSNFDTGRSQSFDSNTRERSQGPDSYNTGRSQVSNSDNIRRPQTPVSDNRKGLQGPDSDNRERSQSSNSDNREKPRGSDSDNRRPQSSNYDNKERPQESDNKRSQSFDSDTRGKSQSPDSDNRGRSQGPDSDNRGRSQSSNSDNREKPRGSDSDNRRPQSSNYDNRERPQESDNKRSQSFDSDTRGKSQSPDSDNRGRSQGPDSDNRGKSQDSISDNRRKPQTPVSDNRRGLQGSDSGNRARPQVPVSVNRGKSQGSDSDNRGRPSTSTLNSRGGVSDSRESESSNYQQNQQCRKNEFRCGNNECLPQSVKCDNKLDCRDGSDEHECVGNRNRQSNTNSQESNDNRQNNGCVLPEPPRGGHYNLSGCDCNVHPGDIVPTSSILNYTCNSNYVLQGNTISVCVDNKWLEPPTCLKVCPPLNSTSVDISCSYKGETVSCSERIMPGTRATLACKSSYKLPVTNDPAYREINCLEDGLWDRRVFRCLPECGTSVARGNTLIVNGFEAKVGVFPWHVGVYRKKGAGKYEQICGGSLISSSLVVSAAHCFYDEANNKLRKASEYAVAGGKRYRDWDANEDYALKSLVASIEAGSRYMGARGNFANDIALVKLKTPFELTALVKPVCIDWDNTHEREQLQVGQAGKVVGWGKDIKGESTRSLQEIDMPFVPFRQCLSAVPIDFRGFLTPDKFCAGRLNGSSVCDGDSGGGLCFEKNGVWYLRGIVSVSPAKGGTCDYHSYVGFTSLSSFLDWVREAYVSE